MKVYCIICQIVLNYWLANLDNKRNVVLHDIEDMCDEVKNVTNCKEWVAKEIPVVLDKMLNITGPQYCSFMEMCD